MKVNLPFSQACENNKQPILEVLTRVFANASLVFEIGSGTGQHAVYFAEHLKHLRWQPSDQGENAELATSWINEYPQPNLASPMPLNVLDTSWPNVPFDAVFSANTAHIMSWTSACTMLATVAQKLPLGGTFALYGPFNYNGQFTSESNAKFHQYLQEANPEQGIRDFEALNKIALENGLTLLEDNTMPANNRCLVWRKTAV